MLSHILKPDSICIGDRCGKLQWCILM